MIAFTCPACQFAITRADKEAGLKIECPSCGQPLVVPVPVLLDERPGQFQAIESKKMSAAGSWAEAKKDKTETIRCSCPHCRASIRVGMEKAGTKAGCPRCNRPFEVPIPKAKLLQEAQPEMTLTEDWETSAQPAGELLPERRTHSGYGYAGVALAVLGMLSSLILVGFVLEFRRTHRTLLDIGRAVPNNFWHWVASNSDTAILVQLRVVTLLFVLASVALSSAVFIQPQKKRTLSFVAYAISAFDILVVILNSS